MLIILGFPFVHVPIIQHTLCCLAIVSIRKLVLTLSTFGTRIEEYSGLESDG